MHTHIHIINIISPLRAVDVAWFTVILLVGIFEDQSPLTIIHTAWTGGHTVRTILQSGTHHTLICTLSESKRGV